MIACRQPRSSAFRARTVAERAPVKEHDRLPSFAARTRTRNPARTRTAETAFSRRLQPNFQRPSCRTLRRARGPALTRRNRGRATLFHGVPPSSCCAFRERCELLGLRRVNTDRFAAPEDCDRRPCGRPPHTNERQCPTRRPRDTRSPLSRASHHPQVVKPGEVSRTGPDRPRTDVWCRLDYHSERRSSVARLLVAGADRRTPRKHTPKTPIEHTPRERNVLAGHPAPRAPD